MYTTTKNISKYQSKRVKSEWLNKKRNQYIQGEAKRRMMWTHHIFRKAEATVIKQRRTLNPEGKIHKDKDHGWKSYRKYV